MKKRERARGRRAVTSQKVQETEGKRRHFLKSGNDALSRKENRIFLSKKSPIEHLRRNHFPMNFSTSLRIIRPTKPLKTQTNKQKLKKKKRKEITRRTKKRSSSTESSNLTKPRGIAESGTNSQTNRHPKHPRTRLPSQQIPRIPQEPHPLLSMQTPSRTKNHTRTKRRTGEPEFSIT